MLLFAVAKTEAQQLLPRTFGARAFAMDDGTRSGKTLSLDVTSGLDYSYSLHFPSKPPISGLNFLTVDESGNIDWSTSIMPALAPGNIWCGNAQSLATPMTPGPEGSILGIENGMPEYISYIPSSLTISASQITSGTIQPGTNIIVGNGATLGPNDGGIVIANQLSGSGPNKYSGSIPIPQNMLRMTINYSAVTATSNVLLSIIDPAGQTAQVSVEQLLPGVGFTIIFSGFYPTATGSLNYLVIN